MLTGLSAPLAAAEPPRLSLEANGQSGEVAVTPSSRVTLSVGVAPGSWLGRLADWWLLRLDPHGNWAYLVLPPRWIGAGGDLYAVQPAHQGPLSAIDRLPVWSGGGLLEGRSTYYFGVDPVMNGWLDLDSAVYQPLVLDVTTGASALIRLSGVALEAGTGELTERVRPRSWQNPFPRCYYAIRESHERSRTPRLRCAQAPSTALARVLRPPRWPFLTEEEQSTCPKP
jgi:hypothetical protein